MKTKYPTSKYVLVCASIVAFTGIASRISVHGPFGKSTTSAQAATQAQPTAAQQQAQSGQHSTASNPPAGSQVYKVQEGDTLWDIAQQFNTTVDDIIAANKLDNASDLQLGQELVISAPSDTGGGQSSTVPSYQSNPGNTTTVPNYQSSCPVARSRGS